MTNLNLFKINKWMLNKPLLFLLTLIFNLNAFSQVFFEEGYFIDNDDQRIDCLIKTIDWNNNPTDFVYKLSASDQPINANISTVKEFALNNITKYVRAKVNIDRSSEVLDKLSKIKDPIFKEEELFLEVLIEGKANLYQYLDESLTRYFYNIKDENIEQLVFKNYMTDQSKFAANNRFRKQLWTDLKCPNFEMSDFLHLVYSKKDLIPIFTQYSLCLNQDIIYSRPKVERDFFNLSIRPSIRHSSLTIQSIFFNSGKDIDFGNQQEFGIGIEVEFILPINKSKWAIVFEPTYQTLNSEIKDDVSSVFGRTLLFRVDYTSIEMPISVRHYFFLSERSKIFVNASYTLAQSLGSSFELENPLTSTKSKLAIGTGQNIGYGLGYKLHDKFSVEMRYQLRRNFLEHNSYWTSNYRSLSAIVGYSIF